MTRERITQQRLLSIYAYDSETGIVSRNCDGGGHRAGSRAGTLSKQSGYRLINIDGNPISEHRLIWLMVTGEWPPLHIDHINRVRDDNRWANLRLASRVQQAGNLKLFSTNTSGYRGVKFHKVSGLWHASLYKKGKQVSLRYFKTKEEAARAYDIAALAHFGEHYTPQVPI